MKYFYIIFSLTLTLAVAIQRCKDHRGQDVTSCKRCLWQPNCEWCTERKSGGQFAVGCVVKNSHFCQDRLLKSEPFVDIRNGVELNGTTLPPIQLSPQRVALATSPMQKAKVDFRVQLADLPVDIYFVMDLSISMSPYQKNLVNTIERIAERVSRLTRDFQFGFGSFSDKPVVPFSEGKDYFRREREPVPYAFRHQLKLTRDINMFKREVKALPLVGNMDSPESGMDGLMQAISCDLVGWRKEVRKVIIFLTDEDTHYAYDGKRAGIIRPHDAQCSLSRSSRASKTYFYDKEINQDYPSFSQIRDALFEKNMVVIFAVHKYMDAVYRELSKFIQGTENVGHLTSNPASMEDVVVKQYNEIKSRVSVNFNASDEHVVMTSMGTSCRHPTGTNMTCGNVKETDVIDFSATIQLDQDACEHNNEMSLAFELANLPDRLNVDIACEECSCNDIQENSPSCNFNGDFKGDIFYTHSRQSF